MEPRELQESIDIAEYISQYVELEEVGGELWGLSPFKTEHTPSFSVRPESGQWYDFSAGCGGDLISFVRRYHGVGFKQAVEMLEQYAGYDDGSQRREKMELVKVARRFAQKEKKKLLPHAVFKDDYMDRFEENSEKMRVWADEGISYESMRRFKVRYDQVANRLVYPIRDIEGRIISVSGRTLDPEYKAKKLRKYTYYAPLGTFDTLYGFYENRPNIISQKEIILFEGAKSVMLADSWGIRNTAALCTSHLNVWQMKILAGLGVRTVFALDQDVDIYQDEMIRKLKRYVTVEVVKDRDGLLQPKMSPVDAGFDVWNTLYNGRRVWR